MPPLTEHHGLLLSRARVLTRDGHDLGRVVDLYFDDVTGSPTWASVVSTTPAHQAAPADGLAVVPLQGATHARGVLRVDVTADQVATAPACRYCDHLDPAEEQDLHHHYGLTASAPPPTPLETPLPREDDRAAALPAPA